MVTNQYIGAMCREYRRLKLRGTTQSEIAQETGFSRETISKFENGTSPNAAVFFWYIKNGIFDWIPYEKWHGFDMGLVGEF